MGDLQDHHHLPLDIWPDTDRKAWAQAHETGDYFSANGLAAAWAPPTRRRCEVEYGRLLAFQMRSGTLKDICTVGERVAGKDDLQAFIDWLRGKIAPLSVVAALGHISMTVRALDPTSNRSLVRRAQGVLRRTAKSVKNIDHDLLPPPELWQLGFDMMEEAETGELSQFRGAVRYRDGLIIAFLSICPLRAKNARALDMVNHLDILDGGRRLSIPAEEMKSKTRSVDVMLPEELARCILHYWEVYRPILAWRPGTDETALWLTTRGTVMQPDTFRDRVERILRERKGVKFTPHMFRHCAATFISDVAPHQAMMTVGVLGHGDISIARKYYIRGQQIEAMRQFQEGVAAIIDLGETNTNTEL